jgi:hypothetical protein
MGRLLISIQGVCPAFGNKAHHSLSFIDYAEKNSESMMKKMGSLYGLKFGWFRYERIFQKGNLGTECRLNGNLLLSIRNKRNFS